MLTVKMKVQVRNKRSRIMSRCHRKGLDFDLTDLSVLNLLRAKRCKYTGLPLIKAKSCDDIRPEARTIDRIDSDRGYVRGNVVACCLLANQLKGRLENPIHPDYIADPEERKKKFREMIIRDEEIRALRIKYGVIGGRSVQSSRIH